MLSNSVHQYVVVITVLIWHLMSILS